MTINPVTSGVESYAIVLQNTQLPPSGTDLSGKSLPPEAFALPEPPDPYTLRVPFAPTENQANGSEYKYQSLLSLYRANRFASSTTTEIPTGDDTGSTPKGGGTVVPIVFVVTGARHNPLFEFVARIYATATRGYDSVAAGSSFSAIA